ncbi:MULTISPECIES: hypothetical protein [Brucella/Ochrobactrum group]|uniref:IrrE N-terminal-like domain-containing protein n=3 Tax=Brucella TaxID=234 RepID=A0A5C5CDL8_9HYPH|nr:MULTISPECIES: hypothetical protein [Brucella/Ochrobactrum group]MCR5944194.1 hypothetical protein [Ochrobactrum sp. XJ1]WPM83061.1 hypothetical protein R5W60_20990 [Brucella pseudintermedia]KAB2673723.1 hypothetical protein F9L08_29095 [Brucella tritici]KAB2739863.1 hypothetical protein F9K89_00240 [Brucella anthropi]MBB4095927.1 hypothetical protein [Brucella pecoris]
MFEADKQSFYQKGIFMIESTPTTHALKPMSGAQLQAARRAAADRFYQIGMSYVPEDYTVKFRKSLTGVARGHVRQIEAPRPVTRKSLYIFLHECAHAHLHFGGTRLPRHVEELQAEKWAHSKMREHGIPVPRTMTERAKKYVARKIVQAEKRGAKSIDPEARRFASSR